MDETGSDLEQSSEAAWRHLRIDLADRLAAQAQPGWAGLSLEVEGGGPAGAAAEVRLAAVPEGVRLDLVGLDATTAESLTRLGLEVAPLSPAAGSAAPAAGPCTVRATLTLPVEQVDRLALTLVRVLREGLGVPHPVFLRSETQGSPPREPGGEDAAGSFVPAPRRSGPGEASPGPAAVYPRDRDHLCRLVDEALAPLVGESPHHDEDGDVAVVSGSSVLYVRVLERVPAVEVFCELVHEVGDRQRAEFEVNVLNRDLRFGRFVLDDDRVLMTLTLPAYPFAPTHLREMLAMLTSSVDRLDDDLVRRVGGRRALDVPAPRAAHAVPAHDPDLDPVAQTEPVHPAMATLQQLEAEGGDDTGSGLTPALVASVCGLDRALLLELIAWSGEQQSRWWRAAATARAAGRMSEADVHEGEAARAGARVVLLRRALRLVVEQQAGRDLAALGYQVVRSEPPEQRESPAWEPDAVLPGLDPRDPEPGLWES